MSAKKATVCESAHLAELKAAIASERQARELDHRIEREHTEALIDERLGETFSASNPIAIPSGNQG